MHADADGQGVTGHGVILRHTELRIRDIADEFILGRYPRPSIEDEQALVRARQDHVVVEGLIELVFVPLNHDKGPCAAVKPSPFQSFEDAAAGARRAVTADDLLDLVGRELRQDVVPVLDHVLRDNVDNASHDPVGAIERVDRLPVSREPRERVLCRLQRIRHEQTRARHRILKRIVRSLLPCGGLFLLAHSLLLHFGSMVWT